MELVDRKTFIKCPECDKWVATGGLFGWLAHRRDHETKEATVADIRVRRNLKMSS